MNDVFNVNMQLYAKNLAERLSRKFPKYKFDTDGTLLVIRKTRMFREDELISMFSCAEAEGKVEPMFPMRSADVPKILFYANEISQECIRFAKKNTKGDAIMIDQTKNKVDKTILTLASYLNMNYVGFSFVPDTSLKLIEMVSCDDAKYVENILWFTDDNNVELMYRTDDEEQHKVLERSKTKVKEWLHE